jgi:ABC-type amino acid transport substrate-binding protein
MSADIESRQAAEYQGRAPVAASNRRRVDRRSEDAAAIPFDAVHARWRATVDGAPTHTMATGSRRVTALGAGGPWARCMRGVALAGAAVLATPAVGAPPAREQITVGIIAIAPYMMAGPNGPHGILIDFFDQEIAPRMGVRFEWRAPVSTARLEQSLIHSQIQLTPLLARTESRERAGIVFVDDVHIKFAPCIAVLPSSALKAITTPADLSGMTIGWVQAAAMSPFLREAPVKLDLVSNSDWETTNIDKLKAGRIGGAYFSDVVTPRYYAHTSGIALKLLKLPAPGVALHAAFAPTVPAALIERYRIAARAAFANNRWEAFLNKALGDP